MNVVRENLADQTALIRVTVTEADYAEKVDKAIKSYKRKANVPGFRPGMVPQAIVNKMYRKGILADETYRIATEQAFGFIKDNKIETIGDLMPSGEQQPLDFDNQTEFDFIFHVGLAPEIDLNLSKGDVIEKIVVTPGQDMVDGYRSNFLRRYGKLVDVDVVEKEEAVSVTLSNEEMTIEDAYVGLISMNDDERAPFIGKRVGDKMEVNINELYKNPSQRASILSVKEDELAAVSPEFSLEITKIRKFADPELNEEFFAMAFPEGDVKNEGEFEAKMVEQVNAELEGQTAFKFTDSVRDYLVGKTNLSLPENFLKEWLFAINEGKFTMEDIEKEFPQFLAMMRWDLIKRKIATDNNIEVTAEDAKNEAKGLALMQFRYYGMNSVADDMLENYANQILSNKEEAHKIYDKVGESKVIDAVAAAVTIEPKSMSIEDFSAMMTPAAQ